MQWTTGQNIYSEDELEALQRTQPPSKSNFSKKKFASANEWVTRFLQEEEFVDHLMKMRTDCQLQKVSLVLCRLQFKKYAEDGILDKQTFMKEMKTLILKCTPEMSDN